MLSRQREPPPLISHGCMLSCDAFPPSLGSSLQFDIRIYALVTSFNPLTVSAACRLTTTLLAAVADSSSRALHPSHLAGVDVLRGFLPLHDVPVLERCLGHLEHVHAPDKRGDPEEERLLRRDHGRQVGPQGPQAAPHLAIRWVGDDECVTEASRCFDRQAAC